MLAVVHCCKVFRCYIEGKQVNLYTDHKPNTNFASQFMPSRRQARWVDLLQGYNLQWHYTPGASNFADPLSRNPVVSTLIATLMPGPERKANQLDILARVRAAYVDDPWFAVATNIQQLY